MSPLSSPLTFGHLDYISVTSVGPLKILHPRALHLKLVHRTLVQVETGGRSGKNVSGWAYDPRE